MVDLKSYIVAVPDFPRPGILFRDVMPLLRSCFEPTIAALDQLLDQDEWSQIDHVAGIESRGFILGAALALRRGKGFIPVRKQGKLPPPVSSLSYQLEFDDEVSPNDREFEIDGVRVVCDKKSYLYLNDTTLDS